MQANVTGAATLAGTVQAVFTPGSYAARTYTILSAAGGLSGTFSKVTSSLPGFTVSVNYTNTDVILGLTAALHLLPLLDVNGNQGGVNVNPFGLNVNQFNVATALELILQQWRYAASEFRQCVRAHRRRSQERAHAPLG